MSIRFATTVSSSLGWLPLLVQKYLLLCINTATPFDGWHFVGTEGFEPPKSVYLHDTQFRTHVPLSSTYRQYKCTPTVWPSRKKQLYQFAYVPIIDCMIACNYIATLPSWKCYTWSCKYHKMNSLFLPNHSRCLALFGVHLSGLNLHLTLYTLYLGIPQKLLCSHFGLRGFQPTFRAVCRVYNWLFK